MTSAEIRKTVRLFGDETEIAIAMRGASVIGVRAIRGKENTMKIVDAVGRQLAAGKPLIEIHWNATVLQELVAELLSVQCDAAKKDKTA